MEDPVGWAARVRDVVRAAGIDLGPGRRTVASSRGRSTPDCCHASYTARDLAGRPARVRRAVALFEALGKVAGSSDRFVVPEPRPRTSGIDRLLVEHARFYAEREALRAKLARAREYDQRIINVRRLKIRTYALYQKLRGNRG